jgi:hypothetical protein
VAAAQQRVVFDIDDDLDPGQRTGHLFISRLVAGAAADYVDGYRPLGDDARFVHIANSFYFSDFQIDYKHSEVRAGSGATELRSCACDPPIYFPTPPPGNAVPGPPPPGSRDLLQFAWYWHRTDAHGMPVALRYRVSFGLDSFSRQIRSLTTREVIAHLSGHEQSFGIEGDTYFAIRGREIFGSFAYDRTARSGPPDGRSQHEITYTNRFPQIVTKWILIHPTLTIGAVSDRGGTVVNVVNPQFEAVWHHDPTDVNVHLVYSPQLLSDSANGWQTTHQIALFVSRALFVKLFH